MGTRRRCWLALLALALAGLLATARTLTPDLRGYGSHQQFGLPPCTFLTLFGFRCPTCGMTTSWACLAHGQPRGALAASVSGTALGVLALATTAWLASAAALGRWLVWQPNTTTALWIMGSLAGITLLEWAFRLSIR